MHASILANTHPHTVTSARSPALSPHPSHLTSPSLSSLVPNVREREIEELQEKLERERQAHRVAEAAKTALEAELESLSQALFEEVGVSSLGKFRSPEPPAGKQYGCYRAYEKSRD